MSLFLLFICICCVIRISFFWKPLFQSFLQPFFLRSSRHHYDFNRKSLLISDIKIWDRQAQNIAPILLKTYTPIYKKIIFYIFKVCFYIYKLFLYIKKYTSIYKRERKFLYHSSICDNCALVKKLPLSTENFLIHQKQLK